MSVILESVLAYLINLASGERSAAIVESRQRKLKEALDQEEILKKALASSSSFRDDVRTSCIQLAQNRTQLGVSEQEEPVWRLLSDETFQFDLAEWFMAGAIDEGNAAKERLRASMEHALSNARATPEQIAFLKSGYFGTLEKALYTSPILAQWRHKLSLDYLREQVTVLRRHAEEAAGLYSPEKQQTAIERYCEKALAAWDIIDLSNLPEGDIHMATQKLLLRQLYMPLRIEVEPAKDGEGDEEVLARMEKERESRRHREAGHVSADGSFNPDKTRIPVGEWLAVSRRLVILGDPGGGKTTMLRWMATSYLLRQKGNVEFNQIPDTETLPAKRWIPVFIRCRDLGEADLCRCFVDFLTQHLNKTELHPDEAEVMRAVILSRIAKGEALLLVDGLDEITNPRVRMMFCQELERNAIRYPDAPIVITSRIVGYRDMPYRMGSGFEHGQIAELNREDKDLFARRWVDVTEQHQPANEKAKRAQELLDALHSNDRIERLTGNPMLLTTLALVKRKVGKLPNKRTKLYSEAVSVLLNWNPRLYQIIEEDEAIPQLEYLAYEMCRRGVQRLADDDVLDLLDNLRAEYPNIRAVKRRDPKAFLDLLEARSSLLIKSGGIWQRKTNQEKPVWEFRHLTFQEYLAARALLDGRFPGRDKSKSLAEQVAPLAGSVQKVKSRRSRVPSEQDVEVPESWREALRLLVADCKDDDVEDVLLAILNPLTSEDGGKTARPRAALATLCVADEPNISETLVETVFAEFSKQITGQDGAGGRDKTVIDMAAIAIGKSSWITTLKKCMLKDAAVRSIKSFYRPLTLWAEVEVGTWEESASSREALVHQVLQRMGSPDPDEALCAVIVIMHAAYSKKAVLVPGLTDLLIDFLSRDSRFFCASAWALGWLNGGYIYNSSETPPWKPNSQEIEKMTKAFTMMQSTEELPFRFLTYIFGRARDSQVIQPLLTKLGSEDGALGYAVSEALINLGDTKAVGPLLEKASDPEKNVRKAAIELLIALGDKQSAASLVPKLDDPDADVRKSVIRALVRFDQKQAVAPLLKKLDDPDPNIRIEIIAALGKLGEKQAVAPLLTKLDDPDRNIRRSVIVSLGELGDKRAVAPLLTKLDDKNVDQLNAAAVLHLLGEPKGTATLQYCLTSSNIQLRAGAIFAAASLRDLLDQRLLSRDMDASNPWIDPKEVITEGRVAEASQQLNLKTDDVRSRYESLAKYLGLKLSWK